MLYDPAASVIPSVIRYLAKSGGGGFSHAVVMAESDGADHCVQTILKNAAAAQADTS